MVTSRLILLFIPLWVCASSFEDFKNTQDHAYTQEKVNFIDFKQTEDAAFKAHLEQEQKAISDYKKKVKALWPTSDLEEAKKLTTYSKDLHTKSVVDFKKNEITIAQISDKKVSKESLLKQLNKTLQLKNKEAFEANRLEQAIDSSIGENEYVKKSTVDALPLLQVGSQTTQIKPEDVSITQNGKVYELKYKLPQNSTYKRSYNYLVAAKSNATRFRVNPEVLLAIMHSESSFNPMARSHIPAFGLMQIVPSSAGIDSYKFLYKERRLLSASYLYNTQNNIEIGSAYFHILYYKYLSSIKDPTSRLYCAIAGYNTGAGNIAWAFTHNNNVPQAAKIINTMTPEEVFKHLQRNLKYDEPKHYLKNVHARSLQYKELYDL